MSHPLSVSVFDAVGAQSGVYQDWVDWRPTNAMLSAPNRMRIGTSKKRMYIYGLRWKVVASNRHESFSVSVSLSLSLSD